MSKGSRTVIAIDMGTTQVRVLAAQMGPAGDIEVLAEGQAPSLGVRRAMVQDVDEASAAILSALEAAGLQGHIRGAEGCVNVGGRHIESHNAAGDARVSRSDGVVTAKDLERSMASARTVEPDGARYPLHAIPAGYRIDGYRCRQSALGMRADTVQAEAHVVKANADATAKLLKAMEMAGKDVHRVVSSGVAASHAVLHAEEREAGVVLLDIGGGTTDIVACAEGAVRHTSVLPLGGNQLANDIAIVLNTSFHVGERILLDHGSATNAGLDPNEELTAPCFGMSGNRRFRRHYLHEVIRLRVTELLQLAMGQAMKDAPGVPPAAGVVLSGGVANLPGITDLAQQVLHVPVRIGAAAAEGDSAEGLATPEFATIMGVLQVVADPNYLPPQEETNGHRGGLRQLFPLFAGFGRTTQQAPSPARVSGGR